MAVIILCRLTVIHSNSFQTLDPADWELRSPRAGRLHLSAARFRLPLELK